MAASLVILALVTCANVHATRNQDPPNAARVAGHVRVGGEPIVVRGAHVTLLPTLETFQPGVTPPCVETDRDGRYAFEGLTPGAYLVAASKTGFPRTAVVPVHVSAGRAIDGVDVFLERGAVITGRISDENGDPLIGVIVEALNTMDQHGAMLRDFVRAGRSSTTDDRGEFRVFDLPPGMYVVEAAIGCPPRCIETHGISTSTRYSYYPGVTDRSAARVIPVTAGQIVTGVDFTVALRGDFESPKDVGDSDTRFVGFTSSPTRRNSDSTSLTSISSRHILPGTLMPRPVAPRQENRSRFDWSSPALQRCLQGRRAVNVDPTVRCVRINHSRLPYWQETGRNEATSAVRRCRRQSAEFSDSRLNMSVRTRSFRT